MVTDTNQITVTPSSAATLLPLRRLDRGAGIFFWQIREMIFIAEVSGVARRKYCAAGGRKRTNAYKKRRRRVTVD